MKKHLPLFLAAIVVCLCAPFAAQAHQPRLVGGDYVRIYSPSVSQAFYDELAGKPREYLISSPDEFELDLQLLVPASANPEGRYSAEVYRLDNGQRILVGKLDGASQPWTDFHEEFANDDYAQSAPAHLKLAAGDYAVEVAGTADANGQTQADTGKYVLVVGSQESFPANEIWNAWLVVPKLKQNFFKQSPLTLVLSAFGPYALAAASVLVLIFWAIAIKLLKALLPRDLKPHLARNLGFWDRALRLVLGLGLLVAAIHYWSLLMFLGAGFLLYEAVAKWCPLYAALGRNTCPI